MARRLTSSNLRGVPSGREGSKLILLVSDGSGDHARELGDRDVLSGAGVDQFLAGIIFIRWTQAYHRHGGIPGGVPVPQTTTLEKPDTFAS